MTYINKPIVKNSRRQFLRKAGILALGTSPFISFAAKDNNEGVSLAGGL
jgi:sulfite dehydrogenase